jgi:hypothetical protein
MLRTTRNIDEIITREIPLASAIGSSALAIFLSFIVFYISTVNRNLELLWIISMGGFALICLFVALTSPITTTKINKPGQTVSVRKRSLIKYSFNVYSFNEIDDLIYVETRVRGRSGKVYQLIMPLRSGEKIELSTEDGSKKSQCDDAASLLNTYIFDTSKQIPFKLTIFNDD